MNVCLVTSARSQDEFDPATAETLVGLGLRVVVLFLHPQPRRLWNRGQIVCYAPSGAAEGLFGDPLEARYRTALDQARRLWLKPLEKRAGLSGRVAKAVERRAYKVARVAGTYAAGRIESTAARLLGSSAEEADPLARLPQGVGAFGVFHALDQGAVAVASEACSRGGALYADPALRDLQPFYENAIMHWLRA